MVTPHPISFDVAVVGAGPAGSSAAARLARRGISVCLIEKEKLPRYKTCGGGILHRAIKLLPIDITPVIEHQCHHIQLNITEKLSFQTHRPDPIVSMVMRDAFDHLLVQHAIAQGAILYDSTAVTALESHPEHIILQTTRGPIQSRWLIAADGANSTIARLAAFPDGRTLIPALEFEIQASPQNFPDLYQTARFDFNIIPHGYAWSFPKRDHLSIGLLTLRPKQFNLNHYLPKYLNQLKIPPTTKSDRHGYIIPLSPRKGPQAKGRILLTGDAAGLADPITAEGITHAIQSAQRAADAIASAQGSNQAVHDYNSWMNKELLPKLRTARRLARLLYHHPHLRKIAFTLKGNQLVKRMTTHVMNEPT